MTTFLKAKKFIMDNKFLLFVSAISILHYINSRFDYNYLLLVGIALIISIGMDKIGHILQYVSVVKLDNNLKRTSLELVKSEQKFREFFSISSVPMAIYNLKELKFVSANKSLCKLLEYTEEELKALTMEDLIHPEDIGHTKNRVEDILKVEKKDEYLNRYITKSGKVVAIIWTSTNSYGNLTYCIAIPASYYEN